MKTLFVVSALAVAGCAPNCNYPAIWRHADKCVALRQQAADQAQAAQQEQAKQAMIAKLGGVAQYNQYMAEKARRRANAAWNASYNYCISQMPVPVTQFQDSWSQRHCANFATSLVPNVQFYPNQPLGDVEQEPHPLN